MISIWVLRLQRGHGEIFSQLTSKAAATHGPIGIIDFVSDKRNERFLSCTLKMMKTRTDEGMKEVWRKKQCVILVRV